MGVDPLLPLLGACMLVTGAANTLLTKYQDMQCVANCDSPNIADHKLFEQPVIQTLQMMMGEGGFCWAIILLTRLYARFSRVSSTTPAQDIVYEPLDTDEHAEFEDDAPGAQQVYDPTTITAEPTKSHHKPRGPLQGRKVLILALPSCCDILATTTMQIGLLYVAASIYQMTRGALVLFVGLLSVIFLKRHLGAWKWASLFIVVLGIAIVGLAGVFEQSDSSPKLPGTDPSGPQRHDISASAARTTAGQTMLGISLIAGAQIFTATQFVFEENIMSKYELDTLALVGWEGTFGVIITVVGMIIMHLVLGRTEAGRGGYFDAVTGIRQILSSRPLAISSVLTMLSIACYNYFGVTITQRVSATSRSTLDSSRTLLIWVVSLGLGWESFKWLQLVGFALVVYGTAIFNEIVQTPTLNAFRRRGWLAS